MYRIKRTDAGKLQDEYAKLVSGLQEANAGREEDDVMANPGKRYPAVTPLYRLMSRSWYSAFG